MEKLNIFGIGPKIGRIALPWLAVTITLSIIYPEVFAYRLPQPLALLIIGIALLAVGVVLWAASGRMMVKAVKETKLLTEGPFGLCRNPLYAAILLFVIPGLSLVLNSWLIPTTCIVGFVIFRQCIREEYTQLEKIFGDAYRKYCSETPEFFPFPWIRRFVK